MYLCAHKHHALVSTMKTLVTSILALTGIFSLSAQSNQLPKWINNPPQSTATTKYFVSSGNDLKEARHNAVNLLIGLTNRNFEEGSYQRQLLDQGMDPINQQQSIVKAAENSLFFPTEKVHTTDGQTWVLCKMTVDNCTAFADSLLESCLKLAVNKLHLAKDQRNQGKLFAAATTYSEGLLATLPVLHHPLMTDEGDVIQLLRDGYTHCLDGITWSFEQENFPMVRGEAIPVPITAIAKVGDIPVSGLPIDVKMEGGVVASDRLTNNEGKAKIRVDKAPDAPTAKINISMNLSAINQLPQHFLSTALPQQLTYNLNTAQMQLSAFDPTPTFALMIDEADYKSVGDSLVGFMKLIKFSKIEDADKADLQIKLTYNGETDGANTIGKYPMQYYQCQMTIQIFDRRKNECIAQAEKSGLRLFLKSNTDEAEVRKLALTEMMKRMRSQLSDKIKAIKFDKRQVVYSEASEK